MLSPTGRCHAFDVAADGFVRSEGCAVVLLKRLPDALRDGDRILAVVRGTAANQDGRTMNIATPSLDAQVAVYRAALAAAGVDAGTVGMVEAHGTGTPVGDPIEFASLAQVYGIDGNRCALGSVKTNFGHTESAAGARGADQGDPRRCSTAWFRRFCTSPACPTTLPEIETGLFVPQEITPWPSDGQQPRRAAVSSYGMSGTNVHAIVEQAPETDCTATTTQPVRDGGPAAVPAVVHLGRRAAPDRRAGWPTGWTEPRGRRGAVGSGLHAGASARAPAGAHRRDRRQPRRSWPRRLREVADGDAPYQAAVGQDDRGPVWVFSGQGSQWAAMGADLLANEPVFAATVAEVEPLIAAESGFSVTEAMSAPETVTGIDRVQPTLFAMQVALAATMKSYGVRPGAVIGHSLGEAAAAVVAGALSLEDGVRVICRRSRLMARIAGAGAMASVELPAQQVLSELAARGVDRRRGVGGRLAAVHRHRRRHADGSRTGRGLGAARGDGPRGGRRRRLAFAAGRSDPRRAGRGTGRPHPDGTRRCRTTRRPCTTRVSSRPAMPATGWTTCVTRCGSPRRCRRRWRTATGSSRELSPHPLLTHAVEQTARSLDMPVAALAGMRREQALPHGLRGFLADLHSAGAAVDFSVLYPGGRLVDAPLPTWTHRPLLLDRDGQDRQAHGASTVAVHPLLGAHVRLPEEPERHVWQADVGTAALPWLGDHQVHDVAALPGAAYCEMALAAARTVLGEASEVRDIRFEQMLLLDDETPVDRRRVGGGARRRRLRGGDLPGRGTRAAGHRGPARRPRMSTSQPRTTWPPCSRPTRTAWTATSCGSGSTSAVFSSVPPSPAWPPRTPPKGRSAPCWPRSGCPARSAHSRAPTACTRRCWMPASSRSRHTPTSRTPAAAACCCRWVCAGCAPTARPATPATATRG